MANNITLNKEETSTIIYALLMQRDKLMCYSSQIPQETIELLTKMKRYSESNNYNITVEYDPHYNNL